MASHALHSTQHVLNFRSLQKLDTGFCNQELVVRLLHSWEARNFTRGNVLMGFELLLLDAESNAAQGFIPVNRLAQYENSLAAGSLYLLKKFILKPSKTRYKVADHLYNILFTAQTSMIKIPEGNHHIARQKFRLRSLSDISATVDTHTDLFDVVGQIRLVQGDNLKAFGAEATSVTSENSRSKDRVFLQLFMDGGETVNVYLWGDIASSFRCRWNTSSPQPVVLLITTVNPKTLGGALSLSSTSATRLFFDNDVGETESFLKRLVDGCPNGPVVASSSSAMTKLESVTIGELLQFIQTEEPQSASFYVFATIVDVVGEHGWSYIACGNCNTKLGKSSTSLYCTKCDVTNNIGLLRYRLEVSVSDKEETIGTFVLFDRDAAKYLGRKADAILTGSSSVETEHLSTTTVPDLIKNIIGKSFKFQIRITPYNFTASRQVFTVSRIVEANESSGLVDQGHVLPIENIQDSNCSLPSNPVTVKEEDETSADHVAPKRARLE